MRFRVYLLKLSFDLTQIFQLCISFEDIDAIMELIGHINDITYMNDA